MEVQPVGPPLAPPPRIDIQPLHTAGAHDHDRRARLFEGILSSTPDFVYAFDRDGRFVYANRRLLEVWGMTLPEILGKTCRELGYEQWHHDMHMREIAQVIATRQPIKGEVPFKAPLTGVFGVYEYIFTPVLDAAGEVELIGGTTRDITDRQRAEEALREADRRKDEFLATLAHELRNPLAPVRHAVEIIKRRGPPDRHLQSAREIIDRQIAYMVRLIDDLLEVNRITLGKLELRRERATLGRIMDLALETAQPHLRQELELSLPPGDVELHADATRLAQVFANLLTNAGKYTPPGGRIAVSARRDGDELAVSVRDDGIGIAAQHLPRIFEMFSQVASAGSQAQGGLGIGLALAKGIVELHGGAIEARSEGAGRGSEFIVRLPIAAAGADAAPAATEHHAAPLAGRQVLVVDDNEDSAVTLATLLELEGARTRVAHDGERAVALAAEWRPDLILLDIGLPKMSGHDACRAIRAQAWAQAVTIVALTGWGQEGDRRRSSEAGFDGHLVKPVDHSALLATVASLQRR